MSRRLAQNAYRHPAATGAHATKRRRFTSGGPRHKSRTLPRTQHDAATVTCRRAATPTARRRYDPIPPSHTPPPSASRPVSPPTDLPRTNARPCPSLPASHMHSHACRHRMSPARKPPPLLRHGSTSAATALTPPPAKFGPHRRPTPPGNCQPSSLVSLLLARLRHHSQRPPPCRRRADWRLLLLPFLLRILHHPPPPTHRWRPYALLLLHRLPHWPQPRAAPGIGRPRPHCRPCRCAARPSARPILDALHGAHLRPQRWAHELPAVGVAHTLPLVWIRQPCPA